MITLDEVIPFINRENKCARSQAVSYFNLFIINVLSSLNEADRPEQQQRQRGCLTKC